MQRVTVENTDVRVSRIAFGTASLHHLFSKRNRRQLLDTAAGSGISHFDTSPYYGAGLAESDVGDFMHGRRNEFTVTTKVGLYPRGGAVRGALGLWTRKALEYAGTRLPSPEVDWRVQRAADSLDASLKRLKTDYVDFLLLHEPDIRLIDADEFHGWVEAQQARGKVRYWGLAGLPKILAPWVQLRHPLCHILQTKDSVVERSADFILERGRQLQFTYGYLSSQRANGLNEPASDVLRRALERNTSGAVLVSTRQTTRLTQLASISP